MRTPNTDIPCSICNGSKINPSHGQQCGACFGTGLSTSPWDQRRRATTVTLWIGEEYSLPEGTEFHGPGKETSDGRHRKGMIYLISWPNPDYKGGPANGNP